MSANYATLVCGFGRCGTTLAMQMLEAGGHPMGEHQKPSYECDRCLDLPHDQSWLLESAGKAVKVLDPHIMRPTSHVAYRIIWLDRDAKQQAKSQVKFLSSLGEHPPHWRAICSNLRRDRANAIRFVEALGPTLVVRFERLLENPLREAERIAWLLSERRLDARAMAAVVEPRDPASPTARSCASPKTASTRSCACASPPRSSGAT